MNVIQHKIPTQGFTAVTVRIAEILKANIAIQLELADITEDVRVFYERTMPYDKSENVIVNVWSENVDIDQQNQLEAQNTVRYFIDTTLQGKENENYNGDQLNSDLLKTLTGWIRYILSNPIYNTLGYLPGKIGGRYVNSISFLDRSPNQEANNIFISRVTFTVRIYEVDSVDSGFPLESLYTNIRVENTEHGYELVFNN